MTSQRAVSERCSRHEVAARMCRIWGISHYVAIENQFVERFPRGSKAYSQPSSVMTETVLPKNCW